MTDQATSARIAAVESQLPRGLPPSYRAFLGGSLPTFPALGPWDASWEQTVHGFQREWHPLGRRLLPVEHGSDGIFACLLLHDADPCPVVAWDIASDLGEQSCVVIAADWDAYATGHSTPPEDGALDALSTTFADAMAWATHIRLQAQADLDRRLQAFDLAEMHFHENYSSSHAGARFEHHVEHAQTKPTEWRPERFAVQDHLLGVMASRYNKTTNTIDVVGFATRDHTNFARGSATGSLVVGLLCDCAAKAASGVRFLQAIPPRPRDENLDWIPREVVVLSEVLGVRLSASDGVIDDERAGRLLLALTPFGRQDRQTLLDADVNFLRLCLGVHQQTWSPVEAAILARWCPNADDLFGGNVDSGEMVRYAAALQHGGGAWLAGFGVRVAETQAELTQSSTTQIAQVAWPYAVSCRTTAATSWTDARTGGTIGVDPLTCLVVIGLPQNGPLRADAIERLEQRLLAADILPVDTVVLGVVPHRTHVEVGGQFMRFVTADRDAADIEVLVEQRIRQARRVRS